MDSESSNASNPTNILLEDSEENTSHSDYRASPSTSICRPPLKRRSTVYNHFTLSGDKWKCNYCGKKYAQPAQGGTGSLSNHLKRSHPSTVANPSSIKKHFRTVEQVNPEDTKKRFEFQKQKFLELLINYIVSTDQPFSVVEDESFQALLEYASGFNDKVKLPSRVTMRTLISDKFQEAKGAIINQIHGTKSKVSVTLDCWTSGNYHPFQGVTAAWISDDWELKTCVLDLTVLEGPHTGSNLALHLSKVLDEFNLWGKLLAVTTDNASNMNTMFENFETLAEERDVTFDSSNYRVRCMAHIINLSCRAILNVIDKSSSNAEEYSEDETNANLGIIAKVRTGVKKIRSSHVRLEQYRRQANIMSNNSESQPNPKSLILDVRTRWNSTLNMLERAVEMKQAYQMTLTSDNELENLRLNEDEWKLIQQLIELLKPFRDATYFISANDALLSTTLSIYEGLFDHLERYLPTGATTTAYRNRTRRPDDERMWLSAAAEEGWKKLKDYYPSADGLVYVIATVMDPRYKDKWYDSVGWNKQFISNCKRLVKGLWNSTYNIDIQNQDDIAQETLEESNSFLIKLNQQMKNIRRGSPSDELSRYLHEPVAVLEPIGDKESSTSVFKWWKLHEATYPKLSRMAKDFLSVSGTGVPCERLFSSATDTLTNRRHRLSPESIRQCLCLKNWLKGAINPTEIQKALVVKALGDDIMTE